MESSEFLDKILEREAEVLLVPIQKLTDQFLNLIDEFIDDDDKKSMMVKIIDIIEIERIRVDPCPFIILLLANDKISEVQALYLIGLFPQKKDKDYFLDLINMELDPSAVKLARKISRWFPKCDFEYLAIQSQVEIEEVNRELLDFFIEMKGHRPCWILTEPPSPLPDLTIPILPNPEEAGEIIIDKLRKQKLDQKKKGLDLLKMVVCQYEMARIPEKMKILDLPITFDDKELFRHYGPLNTSAGCPATCRMLTCCHFSSDPFEDIYENPDELPDWFVGECENRECGRIIPKRCYAVRLPLLTGGWMGCFCSIECLSKDLEDDCLQFKINYMNDQLREIGIYDKD